ncbi:MAG TPA: bifunctional diaminohydroxyphosphoribosylaminopyrimidine deaminase/5-amino-6-(5-phosphoribosylamino)uracil reductase RibD [Longimicrobiales bacterium]
MRAHRFMQQAVTPGDREYMRRALALAARGWGRVHPNPLVGAVVVRDGEVVGEGAHGEYGGPHAEVVALKAAGERARGATLYVTLEPCAHYGKTPPCTDAIRAAGVARVVMAVRDPSPVAGGGAERLRAEGIEVVEGVEREAARAQNAAFFHGYEAGTPFVALKYALSLDGKLAAAPGRPTAVTGAEARAEAHRLRAGFDAILVGIGTVLADDPLLTVRGGVTPRIPPRRIVVDTAARLPLDSRLMRTIGDAPVAVVCAADAPAARRAALERAGARVLPVPRAESGVALDAMLAALRDEGVHAVFCEGGGRLGTALLAADRVERMFLFIAPRIFGPTGVSAFGGDLARGAAAGWRLRRLEAFGNDALVVLDRARGS